MEWKVRISEKEWHFVDEDKMSIWKYWEAKLRWIFNLWYVTHIA